LDGLKKHRKRKKHNKNREHLHTRLELDSHADTCAFGPGCLIVFDTGRLVCVAGFDSTLGTKSGAAIATIAVAYDCPTTLRTYILFFHEALYIPTMTTHLVNPFQLRAHGVDIQDIPLQHLPPNQRLQDSHTISVADKQLSIPLNLRGTMSGCTVREPTWEEVQDSDEAEVIHVHLTGHGTWDPKDPLYAKQERALQKYHSQDIELRVQEP
jgi:hypothetical protein